MGDIGERPAVNEGRIVFQRLHQVGHQRVFQKHRHRAIGLQLFRGYRFALAGLADDDVAESAFEVRQRIRKAEDRHDLRRDRDVVPGFAGEPVGDPAQADGNVGAGRDR